MRAQTLTSLVAVVVAAAAGVSCSTDPVHDSQVTALGPEAANIPQGPYHRAGQPCAFCHGGEGPASTQFSIAGTVFFGPANGQPPAKVSTPIGVGNVVVQLEDDAQSKFAVTTNCVGNFWIKPSDWNPQFPVLVTIQGAPQGQTLTKSMQSHIGRTASCAECHQYPTNLNYFQTPGIVYLSSADDAKFTGDSTCPVQPPVPAGFGVP